jgi:hypothetical protein
MTWRLVLLATVAGCAGGSSYLAEAPQQERARSPEHSAALAKELLSADGKGQAIAITRACDLGYSTGRLDGFEMGIEMSEGVIKNHCLGAITPDMLAHFVAEVGNDTSKLGEKLESVCGGARRRRPAGKYGETLLILTRNCEGNQLCGLTVHAAFTNCYMAGVKESVAEVAEKALDSMFQTCAAFHAEEPACHNDARSMMIEIRTLVSKFPSQQPAQ